ncbi:UNVERIFIED_CONTAM: hypothetical protein N8J90_16605 [Halobacillus marinus]
MIVEVDDPNGTNAWARPGEKVMVGRLIAGNDSSYIEWLYIMGTQGRVFINTKTWR